MQQSGLIITNEFPPYPGGIGVYNYQIALNLSKMNIPIVVVSPGRLHEIQYQTDDEFDSVQPFPIYRLRSDRISWLRNTERIIKIINLCRAYNVGWILCGSLHAYKFALVCHYLLGIPYFVTGYGSEFLQSSRLQKIASGKAAGLFAISKYTGHLMESAVNHPVSVIPIGADHRVYDPALVSIPTIEQFCESYAIDGAPILVSVGRLNQRKGHHVTLAALPSIKEQFPNVQLVIVGRSVEGEEGYEASLQRFIVEHGLEATVRIIPTLTTDELRTLYALSDLFILSSVPTNREVEGFGIVLIEANLMGKPVVAASTGGITDAVEDGKSGYLYTCGDVHDLAQKVLKILNDDSLCRELGEYGRTRALKSYTWEAVTRATWQQIVLKAPTLKVSTNLRGEYQKEDGE